MPLQMTTPGFWFDTAVAFRTAVNANATSSCLQHGREKMFLCEPLFIIGALVPVFIWLILPSTSEVVSYRILGVSSLAQCVLATLWAVYVMTTGDTSRSLFYRGPWVFLTELLLCVCTTLGIIGHRADKCGKRLERESFDVLAKATLTALLSQAYMLGNDLLDVSSMKLAITGYIFTVIVLIYAPKAAMTMYYHFMTRCVSSLHWPPQNGSKAHFNPWWSRALRFI